MHQRRGLGAPFPRRAPDTALQGERSRAASQMAPQGVRDGMLLRRRTSPSSHAGSVVTTTLLLTEDLVDNIIRPDSVDIHIFKMSLHFLPILHYQAKQAPVCLHVLITWDMGIPPT